MKKFICLTVTPLWLLFSATAAQAQQMDTVVDIGGYNLHFRIIKGTGTPILFESGGGDDGSVWDSLAANLHKMLDAPLITYDREGFGRSDLDTSATIVTEVRRLETGLKDLGFHNNYFLVAHSLGGCYSMVFTARNQAKVKGAVFIDISTPCFMTVEKTKEIQQSYNPRLAIFRKERPGVYFLLGHYETTLREMREAAPKVNMPITVIGSDHPPYQGADSLAWKNCVKSFGMERPNRKYILAANTGHYVFLDAPKLVADEILTLYQKVCR